MATRSVSHPIDHLILSAATRPLRFAGTGGTAAAIQLLLLLLMTRHGWSPILANCMAFLVAAQVNFALSVTFTWHDRCTLSTLPRHWLLFHASIALMALVNMLVFAGCRLLVPLPVASLAGIAAGAVGNYLLGDRIVFRQDASPGSDRSNCRAA